MNLTPKQIQALRIAVAEVDGWSDIKENVISIAQDSHSSHKGELTGSHPMNMSWRPMVPNYPESLDAVHEAWLTLSEEEKVWFQTHLQDVLIEDGGDGWLICASATQRCIALLRTRSPKKWLEIQNLKD